MTGRPDGPFQPVTPIPDILLPRLSPHLLEAVGGLGQLRAIEGTGPNGIAQSPYILFPQRSEGACAAIASLVYAAEHDNIPVVLEVGPGTHWTPLETSTNLRMGTDGKRPLTIGVELPMRDSRALTPVSRDPMPDFDEAAWAALFSLDALDLTRMPEPPHFDAVHFIAPSPRHVETIGECGLLVKPGSGRFVVVLDPNWLKTDQLEIAMTLHDQGFRSIQYPRNLPSESLVSLTGATDSDFIDPHDPNDRVHAIIATNRQDAS